MPLINIRNRKRELRAKYKRARASIPEGLKAELDKKLTERFLALEEYRACSTLFIYVSSPIECDTSRIIADAFSSGRRVAVPRCGEKSGDMDFYYITSLGDLEPGKFGIMEPVPEKCEKAEDLSAGLCVVPGLCFDLQGYRIGFGKGYYDRFLQRFGGVTVGVCYYKCIQNDLPTGVYDKTVDILLTEKFINRNVTKE